MKKVITTIGSFAAAAVPVATVVACGNDDSETALDASKVIQALGQANHSIHPNDTVDPIQEAKDYFDQVAVILNAIDADPATADASSADDAAFATHLVKELGAGKQSGLITVADKQEFSDKAQAIFATNPGTPPTDSELVSKLTEMVAWMLKHDKFKKIAVASLVIGIHTDRADVNHQWLEVKQIDYLTNYLGRGNFGTELLSTIPSTVTGVNGSAWETQATTNSVIVAVAKHLLK